MAPLQRMNASVIGGTCPTMKRPKIVLPAQNSEVSESSRYGWSNSQPPLRCVPPC